MNTETAMRYATIDEAFLLEFGVTGEVKTIDGSNYELLRNEEVYCWACRYEDADGNMLDWDYVTEDWAKEIGLI